MGQNLLILAHYIKKIVKIRNILLFGENFLFPGNYLMIPVFASLFTTFVNFVSVISNFPTLFRNWSYFLPFCPELLFNLLFCADDLLLLLLYYLFHPIDDEEEDNRTAQNLTFDQ